MKTPTELPCSKLNLLRLFILICTTTVSTVSFGQATNAHTQTWLQFTGNYSDVVLGCNPANPGGSLGTATATSACGGITITYTDGLVMSNGCERYQKRTFTARDACGHTATKSRTVRWTYDHTPPTININGGGSLNLGCNPSSYDLDDICGNVTAYDNCCSPTLHSSDGSVVSQGCYRSQTRTWTARDACGNTATAARTVTWIYDHTPPSFTGSYDDVDLGCNPANPSGSLGIATATDACGAVTITSSNGSVVSNGCNRSQKRTFTAKDGCGNTATKSRTVRWISDQIPPSFTGSYNDINLGCNPTEPSGSLGTATATDACGAVTITSSNGSIVSDGCNRSLKRTFTARDGCNNTATTSRTVRWISDLIPPSFTGSYDDVILGCNPAEPAGSLGTATATDACGAVTITSSTGSIVNEGCYRSIKRTFMAKDGCNNTATTSRTVRWISDDHIPPSFTGSYADVDLGCNPIEPGGSLGTATATDACGAVTITSSNGSVVSDACNRSQKRIFTARDGCGNTATISRTVSWISDLIPPVFTGNYDDVNLTCNAENAPGSLGTATATDACGAVTITSSTGSIVSNDCNRSITRTFTARDGCNNTATISRTVKWKAILTSPILTIGGLAIPASQEFDLGCNPSDLSIEAQLGTANATNGCSTPTVTALDGPTTTSTSNACGRVRARTFSATDDCGHIVTAVRIVRWIVNNLGPQINTQSSTPTDLGCNPSSSDINAALGTVTATDACANITITSSDGSVVSEGCSRSKTRTFTATGGCGNTITASRTVTWKSDQIPPSFTGSYADVNLGCNPTEPGGSLGSASATDACGAVTITSSTGSVLSDGCSRSQKRTFTARDGCNNTTTTSRTVRWTFDNTPPTIIITGNCPSDLGCNPGNNHNDGDDDDDDNDDRINTNGGDFNPIFCNATATDACGAVTLTSSTGSVVSNGCNRSQTKTWTAKDACGNTSTASRTVTWIEDHTPPSFTGNYSDVNLGCNPTEPGGSLGSATATDACSTVTITSSTGSVISNGCSRSQKRTFTAKDACGNTATRSRTVRWTFDNTPPTIIITGNCPSDLGCNPVIHHNDGDDDDDDDRVSTNGGNSNSIFCTATATDACGKPTLTSIESPVVSNGCSRSQTKTWTATDACGNTSTASRTVTWTEDHTPPVFTGSYGDVNLTCNAENAPGSLGTATATDACGAVTITSSTGSVMSDGCFRSIKRTFTAKDGCNNTATISRTVKWKAVLTSPILTIGGLAIPASQEFDLGCNPTEVSINATLGTANATNGCATPTVTALDGPTTTSTSNACVRVRARTFTATDDCGHIVTAVRIVRWIVNNLGPQINPLSAPTDLGCNPSSSDINAALGTVTATDACANVTITSSDGSVVSEGCSRSKTRTFTATGGCGNTATASRTVTWTSDQIPPSFTGSYADVDLGCNPTEPDGSLGTATATDACGAVTITSSNGSIISNGCSRSITRTFTARDGCNNTATTSRTVRWTSDQIPPSFTGSYTDVDLGCNPTEPGGSLGTATATDACGAVTITSSTGSIVSNDCNRSITRTFTARDGCNNTATTSRTVRWTSDNIPPSFTGSYTDVDLGCNPTEPGGSLGTATATDACGAVTITSSNGSIVSNGCNRSITRTFTARDGCNNTATTSRTVRWTSDNIPPSFTGSYTDVDLGCNPTEPGGSLGTATATDACGAVTITSSNGSIVSNGCSRSITRTFTARDACNNTATTSRTVRWTSDNTPPTIIITGNCPSDLGCNPGNNHNDGDDDDDDNDDRINTNGGDFNPIFCNATATDACGAVTLTSSTGSVVSNGCNRSQTRTWTAKDACGNTSTTSRTVTWTEDHTPPVFTGNYSDIDLGCNPADPSGSLGTATATDACGAVTITSFTGPVIPFGCHLSQTRIFTAKDACGNITLKSRTVKWIFDQTPPIIVIIGDHSPDLGCNPSSIDLDDICGIVTAVDPLLCDLHPTLTHSDGPVVSNGCNRSQTRTWTATDGCGNTATKSITVTWTSDHNPPVFTGSYTDVDLGCNPTEPGGSLGTATATDACGAVTITSSNGSIVSNGCSRSITRTFTARDGCNNTATTSRTVRWTSDNIPPSFTGSYTDVDLGCNPTEPGGSLGTATATDACGAVTITSSNGSIVSNGCNRSITRTFTARDGCNNTATTSRTVRWTSDQIPPSFTGSYADVDLGCNPTEPGGSLGTATATDVCGAVTITSSTGSIVSNDCNRSITRTFTARDGCNNTATISRTVRWTSDNIPPSFTGSYTDVDLGCNPTEPGGSLGTATATDACGAVTITSSNGSIVSNGCSRSITRTFTARDGCNNTTTTSRTVRWTSDQIPPSFTGSYADVDLGCNPTEPGGSLGTATATDACGAVTITSSNGSIVSNGCSRSITRTFTARDACNNTATTSRTVRWTSDNTPPTIIITGNCPSDLGCNPGNNHNDGDDDDDDNDDRINTNGGDFNPIFCNATATDACGAVTLTSSTGSVVSNGCNRSQTRTWTAKDACGNTSTTSRTVTWTEDHTPPVFTGNYSDIDLGCNPADPSGSLGTATATDACGAVTITSFTGPVIPFGCHLSQTRIFTAKDACGNITLKSRTVKWIFDQTPPIIVIIGDHSPDLGCNPSSIDLDDICGIVTAVDPLLCDLHPTLTHSDGPVVSNGCNRSQTRTWTATDGCGNTATKSITVTWTSDHNPPVFTGSYTDVDLGCNPTEPGGSLGTATATDACGAVTITSSTGSIASDGCSRSQKRTFTARDGCNNTTTTSRTVRWTSDVTPPVFTSSLADVDLGCNPIEPGGSLGSATATDACGAVTITSDDGIVLSIGCSRSQKRTFTAKDACGNAVIASRTVRWTSDLTAPTIIITGGSVDIGCNPSLVDLNNIFGNATATDACGPTTLTSSDGSVVNEGCSRSKTRTWTAKDACGNTSTASRTLTWTDDHIPPSFTGSYADVDLGCNPIEPGGSLGTATATDACGAVTITSSNGSVVSDACNRSLTRTFIARDGCNNTATTSRTVRWISDQTPPSFTGNFGSYDDVILVCNAENAPGSLGSASATDACGPVTITSSDGSVVSDGCSRSITRTFTAKDGCNNTATISRTVRWLSILSSPVISVNGQSITGTLIIDLLCNPSDVQINATLGTANATNGCINTPTPTVTSSDAPLVSDGCHRTLIRTFSATDGCGNTATAAIKLIWIANLIGPSINPVGANPLGTPIALGCNPSIDEVNGALGTVSATDGCGNITISSSDAPIVSDGCYRSKTRTFTATGGCSNTATASRTVTWTSDQIPPSFTGSYADVDLGCNPTEPGGSLGSASATDACGAVTITSSNGSIVSNGCSRSITRTFTARDACNNTATTSRTVRWTSDNTPPTIIITGNCPSDLGCNPGNNHNDGDDDDDDNDDRINTNGGDFNPVFCNATATDACGGVTLTSSTGSVISNGCSRSQTKTWTAKDACGNTSTASRTVTWTEDHTPPVFTGNYGDINLGCNPDDPEASLGSATATDACGAVTITSITTPVIPIGCDRYQKRIFTAKDACGNIAITSRTVKWTSDHIPPTIIITGDRSLDLGCNPSSIDLDDICGIVIAIDLCGHPTLTSSDGAVVSNGCSRSQTRTWIATDDCGNTSTTSRTVTWTFDHTPPVFTGNYDDVNLTCNAENAPGSLGTATATDACGAVTITSSTGSVMSDGCFRSIKRTFTAKDGCNNTATISRTVKWKAVLTSPILTIGGLAIPASQEFDLGCNPPDLSIEAQLGTANATNGCSTPTVTALDGPTTTSTSNACGRVRIRTFSATDDCGHLVTAVRIVRWIVNNLGPQINTQSSTPTDLGCNPSANDIEGALGTITATDACANITITSSDGSVVSEGCSRSKTRTFTATGGCGNTATASRTVTWKSDVIPPAFTSSLADVDLGCNPANPEASLGSATATDACGAVTITSDDGFVLSIGCSRSQKRTFTAKDACGNAVIASRTVRWTSDVTPPSFTSSLADVDLGCNPANPEGSLGSATATDACGAVTITSDDGFVLSIGCSRSQKRTFTAKDACGNAVIASRTVRWTSDVIPPVFTSSLADVDLGCNPANPEASLGSATATDACGAVTITSDDGFVLSIGCSRSQKRTFTAKDACGNAVIASRTVRWTSDVTPPSFTSSLADVDLGCNPANPEASLGSATATDACGAVTITSDDGIVLSIGCSRSQKRTFTAKDACGNAVIASRTVRWTSDLIPPSFTGSYGDVNLGCNPTEPSGSLGTATATDACGAVTITSSNGSVISNGCSRSQKRTFTARDGCGNTATTSRTLRWTFDQTAPTITITGGGSLDLGCNPYTINLNSVCGNVTATDACSTPTVTSSDGPVVSNGCDRSQTRTWTAKDACGNTSTASRTVRWTYDHTNPVFTSTPACLELNCNDGIPGIVAPTASDACCTPTVTLGECSDNFEGHKSTTGGGCIRIITRNWIAEDCCGNKATYTQTIRINCCQTGQTVCTLTQGAYGNAGGNICLPNGTTVNQTQIMITALTNEPGNQKVFGRQDLNRYWVIRLTDVNQGVNSNIFKMLPGGSSSKVFELDNVAGVPEYNNGPSWPVAPLQIGGSQSGKIRNQLFAQTLTLYFNTTITGSALANVSLDAGSLALIAPRHCGSSEPAGLAIPTQLVSPSISSYLAGHGYSVTIAGLLQLANDALGGVNISPLTLDNVHDAVNRINELFDDCRILTGYVPANSDDNDKIVKSKLTTTEDSLVVSAFPNPYKENFSLKVNSPITGQALISFYTIDGVKVGELKREVVANKDVWVPYNVPPAYRTRLVYSVSVGHYYAKGIVLSPN